MISYFFHLNNWESANKVSYQRVLYFSAALSPIFIKGSKWDYDFSNTLFGPYNNEISENLQDLYIKNDLELVNRNIYANRIEESFRITPEGIKKCETYLFKLSSNNAKVEWFKIIVNVLSLYGESFLSKLVKSDPNVLNMNEINNNGKITLDASSNNISKEFFEYLQSIEVKNLDNKKNLDILLIYFDILFRKYKGDE